MFHYREIFYVMTIELGEFDLEGIVYIITILREFDF